VVMIFNLRIVKEQQGLLLFNLNSIN
jgi:hypothetical protein